MIAVTRRAVRRVVECDVKRWIHHGRMFRMNGRGERWDIAVAAGAERLRGVASGTQDCFAVRHDAPIEPLRIEPACGERGLIESGMIRELMLVVQPENIQPE